MNVQTKTTKDDQQNYAACLGNKCPVCQSETIASTDTIQTDAGIAWQDIGCEDCGASWQDIYKLEGFQNLQK